jgi:outer membrane protein OmpA-like peptidoglycan-associated protein
MGMLNKHGVSSPTSLLSFLNKQKSNIVSAAPDGLGNVLGIGDLSDLGSAGLQQVKDAGSMIENEVTQGKSFLKPLIGLALLLLAALFAWKSCAPQVDTTADISNKVQDTVSNVAASADNAGANLGDFLKKSLPNGVDLNIPKMGVENKLLSFIEDPASAVNDTTWFSFDRLNFETGSANLKPDSQEQLKNIAGILEAYPNVTLKVGGYTDNTGNPEANLKLSQDRADSVRNALIALGVNGDRLQAKGYGEDHPVASNDTAEGREKNRRIDVQITTK